MSQQNRTSADWHTSSYSSGANNCVEVSEGRSVSVRDTQNRPLGHLTYPTAEWTGLLRTLRNV